MLALVATVAILASACGGSPEPVPGANRPSGNAIGGPVIDDSVTIASNDVDTRDVDEIDTGDIDEIDTGDTDEIDTGDTDEIDTDDTADADSTDGSSGSDQSDGPALNSGSES